jgi:hypothetical protein
MNPRNQKYRLAELREQQKSVRGFVELLKSDQGRNFLAFLDNYGDISHSRHFTDLIAAFFWVLTKHL